MLKSLISEPDPAPALPLDGLFETLSQTLPAEESLNGRIQRLAEGLVETTFITGALVVVVGNDGEALDLASAGFYGDPLGGTDFDDLNRLARDLSSLADWSHIATGRLIRNTTNPERGLLLLGRRLNSGLLFVSTNADFPRKELIHSLRGAEPFLSWILQDAIRVEASRLQSELRQAEIRILCKPNPISVQGIVEELRSVFRADEATLWIQEQNKLFLSATTDPSLAGRPAAYDSGQGLTGWIYKHGWSLRLRNALDPEEISEKTKGKTQRRPPIHPEGISTEGKPVRMLAVPLRAGKKIRGVIRLLKRGTRPPFSGHELSLLERTASLMAVAIHSSWQLYQANAILTAETEAICISTTAKRRGEHVPTITTADPGAVSLFGKSQQQLEGSIASDFYAAGEYERVRKFLLQARHQEQKKKQRKEDRVKQQIVAGPLQTRIRTKDGVRPAKISYRLLSSPFTQPSSKYTIAVIQPIQEVSAENHIANLLDKMNLAYFRTDIEGN